MYLKQIKIAGFKSFVDKLNIDFERGITGIVGPNGSGKSNIVDAVRWVLGEQSVKSLRGGGSMTDVIFSGSKTRNPSSLASVVLTFDNEDKYFPVDYSEIAIKRVVYRTGENEYFLNNEKCRLKDITNLIVDSGMAKESFNIITQGNIQDILSSRPEERRIIFEEAAGVLKYKKRKDEAIRKLDRTHENIARVNDIINELAIQVAPLKDQSEKAQIFLDSKKELEQIEIALIAEDIQKINDEYHFTKKEIETINEEIVSLNTEIDNNNVSLEKVKFDHTKANELLYKTQKELINITSEVEKLSGQKNIITERKKYHSDDIKLHDNVLMLKEQQFKLVNDIDTANLEIDNKRQNIIDIDKRIAALNNIKNDNKQKKEILINKVEELILQKTEIKHKMSIIDNSIENNQRLLHSVKSVLASPKLKGIHNIIGELIDTKQEYVTAIDISLGLSSQFIVVDDEQAAKEAIRYLKTNHLGRATFFPINVIKSRKVDDETYNKIKNHLAFVDIASNLVMYENKYQNIILNQLGAVIVANNIDGANEIGKLINYRYKIVTLDGELLHIGGSITGGQNKKTSNVFNEKYEIEELEKKLNNIDKEYSNYQLKLNDVDILIKEYEHKEYHLILEKDSTNQNIDNKLKIISENQIRLGNVTNELKGFDAILNDMLNEEEEKTVNDYYETLKQKDNLNQKTEDINKKINSNKEQIEEYEIISRKLMLVLSEKEKALKKAEINNNRLEVKLDNLLNRLNEEYSMTFEKARNEYILMMDEKEARKKVDILRKQIKDLGVVNIAAIEEYERVSQRYDFLTNQKNDLFKAENTLLEIIEEMDLIMKELFEEAFKLIQVEFKAVFKQLFGGGNAELKLVNPENILETGIDIIALPPGKKLQHISLLSGGEKALTAISLLFAILKVRPVPFCLLDEIEAALDEVNVLNFAKFLKHFKEKTQFIIITHKKKTMEYVDVLYGVTMQESGVSKLVSVKLEEKLQV